MNLKRFDSGVKPLKDGEPIDGAPCDLGPFTAVVPLRFANFLEYALMLGKSGSKGYEPTPEDFETFVEYYREAGEPEGPARHD
jgi:hypothetical protein